MNILSNGVGYSEDPRFTISSGGAGCKDFTLLGKVGDMTGDKLPADSTTTVVSLASSASSIDEYYTGMTLAITSGDNEGELRTITAYSADGRAATHELNGSIAEYVRRDGGAQPNEGGARHCQGDGLPARERHGALRPQGTRRGQPEGVRTHTHTHSHTLTHAHTHSHTLTHARTPFFPPRAPT